MRPAVISSLLPTGIIAAESFDHLSDATLFPEEDALVAKAVEKRRREFATVRGLARRALADLGLPPVAILPGANREPLWPAGIVGSLTHCAGYCAAVVARADVVSSVGIDAEVHEPLPDGILDMMSCEDERAWLRTHAASDARVHWDRLLFSAKESIYKAWFPLARRWLGFEDVILRVDPESATFYGALVSQRLDVNGRTIAGFDGRFLVHGAHVLTAVTVTVEADRV